MSTAGGWRRYLAYKQETVSKGRNPVKRSNSRSGGADLSANKEKAYPQKFTSEQQRKKERERS